jgi:tyrosyl-tRNA synthetase
MGGQLQQIGFMRQVLFGGFESQIGKDSSHAAQIQVL